METRNTNNRYQLVQGYIMKDSSLIFSRSTIIPKGILRGLSAPNFTDVKRVIKIFSEHFPCDYIEVAERKIDINKFFGKSLFYISKSNNIIFEITLHQKKTHIFTLCINIYNVITKDGIYVYEQQDEATKLHSIGFEYTDRLSFLFDDITSKTRRVSPYQLSGKHITTTLIELENSYKKRINFIQLLHDIAVSR